MKKIIFLLLIVPIIKYGQNNNSMKFNHQALLVNDLNQSGDFYNNILGFEEIEVGAGQNPPKRWFKSDDGMEIHLISTKEKLKSIPKGVHMAFSVKNFDLFINYLKGNNITYGNWRGDKNQIQLRNDGYKQIFFQDPQGYWIEVNNVK
ncbi:VOC family protein [Flavobacteriales bacterium]|nr:VOC family protein [Flavobacteriales bacterium]